MPPAVPPAAVSDGLSAGKLYPLYESYKKGTATIIDYLQSPGKKTPLNSSAPRLPVSRVFSLAQELAAKAVSPPKYIRDAFDLVLVNRRKITEYHERTQKDKETIDSTEQHKHFNETLARAYDVLFPDSTLSRKAAKKAKAAARISGQTAPSVPPKIDFTSTNLFETISNKIELESPSKSASKDPDRDIPPPTKLSAIEDDPLEKYTILDIYVTGVTGAISTCRSYWEECAQDKITLPLAGWLTMFSQELIRLAAEPYDRQYGGFSGTLEEWAQGKKQANEFGKVEPDVDHPLYLTCADRHPHDIALDTGKVWPLWATLKNFRDLENSALQSGTYTIYSTNIPLAKYIGTAGLEHWKRKQVAEGSETSKAADDTSSGLSLLTIDNDDEHENKIFHGLFRDILYATFAPKQDILPKSATPLDAELWNFMEHPGVQLSNSLGFGIRLFVETTRSYVWTTSGMNGLPNLWQQTLEFARYASDSISECRHLVKDDTNYAEYFNEQLFEKWDELLQIVNGIRLRTRFDLYHQSPWVAGAFTSGILADVQFLGVNLLTQGGFFGLTLHLYNMLRHISTCREIVVLEKLCGLFTNEVFMNETRPTSRFSNLIVLFCGAELSIHKGKAVNHRTMFLPEKKNSGRTTAFTDKARIDTLKLCTFAHQIASNGIYSDVVWNRIADVLAKKYDAHTDKKKKIQRGQGLEKRLLQQFELPEILRAAYEVMAGEFNGERKYNRRSFPTFD
jgi:hypothetical protein